MAKRSGLLLNRTELIFGVAVLVAILVGTWIPKHIVVSVSPSLYKRIFVKLTVPRKIKDGDYYIFRREPDDLKFVKMPEGDLLIKKVGCGPGQILRQNASRQWFCGDQMLGTSLVRDSKGRLLPQFSFRGVIPADSYFMVGDHPRSFDSRYLGFVHKNDFICKALPVWPL